jgi:hypothetical protein
VKVVFRNIKHHKSGKLLDDKGGNERVLDVSNSFAEEPGKDLNNPIREKNRGRLNKLMVNEA